MNEASEDLGLDGHADAALRAFEAEASEVFPALGAAQLDDHALIASLADRTVATAMPATMGTGGMLGAKTIAIIAAVVTTAIVAIVRTQTDRAPEPLADVDPPAAIEPAPAITPPELPRVPVSDASIEPEPVDVAAVIDPNKKPKRTRAPERQLAPEPAAQIDAATLLREGNDARRGGDHARARAIYRRIRKEYPGTREDMLVRVSLGQLALDHFDDPTDALEQFGAYLRDRPEGTLAEEAALGRIRALRELGRADAEKAMLVDFLARFPDSIQKETLTKRLARLDP